MAETEITINGVAATPEQVEALEYRFDDQSSNSVIGLELEYWIRNLIAEKLAVYIADLITKNPTQVRKTLGRGKRYRELMVFLAKYGFALNSELVGWVRQPTSRGSVF